MALKLRMGQTQDLLARLPGLQMGQTQDLLARLPGQCEVTQGLGDFQVLTGEGNPGRGNLIGTRAGMCGEAGR